MAEQARRADHLGRIREGEGPAVKAEKEAPHVTKALADWLDEKFPGPSPRVSYTLDAMVATASEQAERVGQLKVISYIRQMIKEQEA